MKDSRECFRCEKVFGKAAMILFESCWFCEPCWKHIKLLYSMPNADDYIKQEPKCKGCID